MEDCAGSNPKFPVRVGRFLMSVKLEDGVFKAVDAHSGHEVICKVLDFTRYRKALCKYSQIPNHPNINQVLEVVFREGQAFVFFPQSFGNLHAHLRTCRRLREDTARRLFSQLLSAVAHCHKHGLVLRDIRLKNFVFKNKERTVLMLESVEDTVVKQGEDHSLFTCPSLYTSPEMLQAMEEAAGGVHVAPRGASTVAGDAPGAAGGVSDRLWSFARASNVWALGVMLYVMLLGRYPDRAGLIRVGVVSPHARCLIRSALHSNPAFRLSASELLNHPWLTSLPRPLPQTHTHSHTQTHDQTVPS